MTDSNLIIRAAVASLLAAGLASSPAVAANEPMEKCGGIVKAGKNDCGTAKHACAAQSTSDSGRDEWVYLPKGTCEKIVGGVLVGKK